MAGFANTEDKQRREATKARGANAGLNDSSEPQVIASGSDGDRLWLTFNLRFDQASEAFPEDFVVFSDDQQLVVKSVSIDPCLDPLEEQASLKLQLAQRIPQNQPLAVRYRPRRSKIVIANNNSLLPGFGHVDQAVHSGEPDAIAGDQAAPDPHMPETRLDPAQPETVSVNAELRQIVDRCIQICFDHELDIRRQPSLTDFHILLNDKPLSIKTAYLTKPALDMRPELWIIVEHQLAAGSNIVISFAARNNKLRLSDGRSLDGFTVDTVLALTAFPARGQELHQKLSAKSPMTQENDQQRAELVSTLLNEQELTPADIESEPPNRSSSAVEPAEFELGQAQGFDPSYDHDFRYIEEMFAASDSSTAEPIDSQYSTLNQDNRSSSVPPSVQAALHADQDDGQATGGGPPEPPVLDALPVLTEEVSANKVLPEPAGEDGTITNAAQKMPVSTQQETIIVDTGHASRRPASAETDDKSSNVVDLSASKLSRNRTDRATAQRPAAETEPRLAARLVQRDQADAMPGLSGLRAQRSNEMQGVDLYSEKLRATELRQRDSDRLQETARGLSLSQKAIAERLRERRAQNELLRIMEKQRIAKLGRTITLAASMLLVTSLALAIYLGLLS